jgi:predicted RNA methylase
MGKHDSNYPRVEKDAYPTPTWVTAALTRFINVSGLLIWEAACGNGQLADALVAAGARVFATDIVDSGYPRFSARHDFLGPLCERDFDGLITNPPYGPRGKLAEQFIETGLRVIQKKGFLALLLPADFDSAKTRARFFGDNPMFVAKIVVTGRITWFARVDGIREAPKENHAWYVWDADHEGPPIIRYTNGRAA